MMSFQLNNIFLSKLNAYSDDMTNMTAEEHKDGVFRVCDQTWLPYMDGAHYKKVPF